MTRLRAILCSPDDDERADASNDLRARLDSGRSSRSARRWAKDTPTGSRTSWSGEAPGRDARGAGRTTRRGPAAGDRRAFERTEDARGATLCARKCDASRITIISEDWRRWRRRRRRARGTTLVWRSGARTKPAASRDARGGGNGGARTRWGERGGGDRHDPRGGGETCRGSGPRRRPGRRVEVLAERIDAEVQTRASASESVRETSRKGEDRPRRRRRRRSRTLRPQRGMKTRRIPTTKSSSTIWTRVGRQTRGGCAPDEGRIRLAGAALRGSGVGPSRRASGVERGVR